MKIPRSSKIAFWSVLFAIVGVTLFDVFVYALPFWWSVLLGILVCTSTYTKGIQRAAQETIVNQGLPSKGRT